MAQARKTTSRKRTASRKKTARAGSPARRSGQKALDRLNAALDDAQKALADVRRHAGRNDLVKDVEKMLKNLRRDAQKATRSVMKDLNQLGESLTPGRARKQARRPAAKRTKAAKRRTTARRTGTAKRRSATKRRSTAKRRTTARR